MQRLKLGRLYPSKELYITQTGHGSYQNSKSIDMYGGNTDTGSYAPTNFGGMIRNAHKVANGGDWFDFYLDGFTNIFIRYVHQTPIRIGHFKPGEKLGNCSLKEKKHCHAALCINGVWYELRDFMSPNDVKIIQARHLKWNSFNYEQWVGWTDRYLTINSTSSESTIMITLARKINCRTTNSKDMALRPDPNRGRSSIRPIGPGTLFETNLVAEGEEIEGVKTWYKLAEGWVNGKYVDIINSSTELENLKKQNAELLEKATEGAKIVAAFKILLDQIK